MNVQVVGLKHLDFTSNEGQRIQGTKIFVVYDAQDEYTEGKVTDSVFIPSNSPVVVPRFKFGDEYDFVYESSGLRGRARLIKILPKGVTNN